MKTGLFFGSFNPVHIGHMAIANYFVEFTDIDQLWFVVSPHNPLKEKNSLLDDYARLEMVRLAIGNDARFGVTDIEFRMPQPSYTIDTLTYLAEKYPDREFVLIMGSDGLSTFHKWKNYTEIINNYQRYIYPRGNDDTCAEFPKYANIKVVDAPKIDISSTFIRKAIRNKRNVQYFLPEKVFGYIDREGYYK
ncbi:MAG: nicotinate-nucleotide adenylyltransferase [Bacteroidales bacterium]|nr:nicotinate-nucleotide adenylyltransferase [Bacteroidales bacterium]